MHPLVRSIQSAQLKKIPQIRPGYTVRVSQKIKEGGKERIQNFEGLVIKVGHGEGVEKTFTVRKIVEGVGVEKIFPMHSPNIAQIFVVKVADVRRSKLYYMRERFGKSARLSERHISDDERAREAAEGQAEEETAPEMAEPVMESVAPEADSAPAQEPSQEPAPQEAKAE